MGKKLRWLSLAVSLGALAALVFSASPAVADNGFRQIVSTGTTSFAAKTPSRAVRRTQLPPALEGGDPVVNRARPEFKKGKFPRKPLDAPKVDSASVADSNPGLGVSFNGLNLLQQETANGGNQFSVEPPDQALCVGNGKVLEAVNSVMRVYNTSGAPLTGVQDLNTFFGYPAQFDVSTGVTGPFVTDPICIYDADINRFVLAILTIDVVDEAFTGGNHLDVAISTTGDPTGAWTIYKIPTQNDGTQGTPSHANCPCIGDYPHIGADANGIYLSTNEYSFFGSGYNGAQIYAIGKQQLGGSSLPLTINLAHIENGTVDGSPGFTVWPALSPGASATSTSRKDGDKKEGEKTEDGKAGSKKGDGVEYFVSTIAGDGSETGNPTGTARRIGVWALVNTSSLNSTSPSLIFSSRLISSETYVFPPKSSQKAGDWPLGQCVNLGCFGTPPFGPEVFGSAIDSNDTRIQQVWFAGGRLYTATDTAVRVDGELRAGIAWFQIEPKINGAGKVEAKIKKQGYLALANNNLTYPAVAVNASGRGIVAFTVLGEDYYPSAGYAALGAGGVGDIHIAAAGLGPDDGFSNYKIFVGDPVRTRWGDYGAAVTDGSDIWFASEYIGQACTLAGWLADQSCGATRGFFGNWYTRISKVTPAP